MPPAAMYAWISLAARRNLPDVRTPGGWARNDLAIVAVDNALAAAHELANLPHTTVKVCRMTAWRGRARRHEPFFGKGTCGRLVEPGDQRVTRTGRDRRDLVNHARRKCDEASGPGRNAEWSAAVGLMQAQDAARELLVVE
jgi:hypothetical protein